jgi:hypothetical protein
MKLLPCTFVMAALIWLSACQKNSAPEVDPPIDPIDTTIVVVPIDTHLIELGKVFVRKNGAIWNVPFRALKYHSDSAFLFTGKYLYPNLVSQTLIVNDIPTKPGQYNLEFWPNGSNKYANQIPHGGFSMFYDSDQPVGLFYLDSLRTDHFIEVVRYDSVNHTVEGRFQAFFRIDSPTTFPNVPDTISFTEGRFHLKIEQ